MLVKGRRDNGFTLLEVFIVLALTSLIILSATRLIVPFKQATQQHKLLAAVSSLRVAARDYFYSHCQTQQDFSLVTVDTLQQANMLSSRLLHNPWGSELTLSWVRENHHPTRIIIEATLSQLPAGADRSHFARLLAAKFIAPETVQWSYPLTTLAANDSPLAIGQLSARASLQRQLEANDACQ